MTGLFGTVTDRELELIAEYSPNMDMRVAARAELERRHAEDYPDAITRETWDEIMGRTK